MLQAALQLALLGIGGASLVVLADATLRAFRIAPAIRAEREAIRAQLSAREEEAANAAR